MLVSMIVVLGIHFYDIAIKKEPNVLISDFHCRIHEMAELGEEYTPPEATSFTFDIRVETDQRAVSFYLLHIYLFQSSNHVVHN